MRLGKAQTPNGMRIYAIGDIHGCDSMLADVHDRIEADIADLTPPDHRIIHIGDYCDRGPDSAGVIARLARMTEDDDRVICLRGNHDQLLLDFLSDPERHADMFLGNGGDATLASYNVPVGAYEPSELSAALNEMLPAADRAFLNALPLHAEFGDYLFVHAGIRPGVPLEAQKPEDLLWIRDEFLLDKRDHGLVVVHGHTAQEEPETRPNRINIDSGAVFGGPLTCVVLEDAEYRFL
jgi:serine/threonine protein phosphatase 1